MKYVAVAALCGLFAIGGWAVRAEQFPSYTLLLKSGAVEVELETAVNNEAAIRFYKRKGYFVGKTVRGYYSNQLDALVMGKDLTGGKQSTGASE